MVDYNEREHNYYNKKIINVMDFFKNYQEILKKLGIDIKEGKYTHYEYEIFKTEILWYYPDEQDEENTKSIDEKGVLTYEFQNLINQINLIGYKYGI